MLVKSRSRREVVPIERLDLSLEGTREVALTHVAQNRAHTLVIQSRIRIRVGYDTHEAANQQTIYACGMLSNDVASKGRWG